MSLPAWSVHLPTERIRPSVRTTALFAPLLWSQKRRGNHRNAVLSAVRLRTGVDDHRINQIGPDLLAQPLQASDVVVSDTRTQFYFDRKNWLIAASIAAGSASAITRWAG